MNPDPIRWVAMKGSSSNEFQVISGPWSRLQSKDVPEQQGLGFETIAVVDSESEAWKMIDLHRQRPH